MINIELTKEEAELFKTFREHQDFFQTLIIKDVHLMRNGNVTLNFNSQHLATVVKTQTIYKA